MTTRSMLDAVGRYAPDQKPDPSADAGDDLTRQGLSKALESMTDVDLGGLAPRLSYGQDHLGRPPTRQTRIFETAVDNPRYPDTRKPITDFFTGGTSEDPTVRATTSQSR